jgi:hypothetical protein
MRRSSEESSAEAAAYRMLCAQERFEAYRVAEWKQRSWLSKMLWIMFN